MPSRAMSPSVFVLALSCLLAGLLPATTHAARITPGQVPEVLRDWVDWVLFPQQDARCPFVYNQFEQRRCAWPTALELDLADGGGRFEQQWSVHADSWITLPGDLRRWPQDVRAGGAAVAVTQFNGRPALRLAPGRHVISGSFLWDRLPESLPIPRDSGLVTVTLAGKPVAAPVVDDAGTLWLRDRDVPAAQAVVGDRLKLQVFRRIVDDLPLQLVTRVELDVSGAQREEVITGALPASFLPLRLDSRLPARLEDDGRLRLQVRPGRWVVEFTARHGGNVESLGLEKFPAPWPAEEVWSFEARNELRLVEIAGAAAVDPAQTAMPEGWRRFPAYHMQPGTTLQFRVIRRGDPEPAPDALTLHRNLWLDFDGGGYTIQDSINGTMTRGWRLEMNAPTQLGQATLDGEPQFVTTRDGGKPGFEVRRGGIHLGADSRYEAGRATVPAVGWDQDFQQVSATLHLPPGWKLFSAAGVDNVPETWIKRWTLLDIFLVLIAALAVRGLWHWQAGLLALVALALIWHEPGAPRAVWLHVLAPIALLRVLPEGWFRGAVTWYRNLALLTLIVITVPFMVNQVRTGLYPQLDSPHARGFLEIPGMAGAPPSPAVVQAPAPEELSAVQEMAVLPEAAMDMAQDAAGAAASKVRRAVTREKAQQVAEQRRRLEQIDPDALVQTGPGLPNWQWRQIPLGWNGPVHRDQQMHFTLLSPGMNLFLNGLRVLLVAALALLMLGVRRIPWPPGWTPGRAGSLAALVLLASTLALHTPPAGADIPDAALLEELKNRLTAPPECLPECAQLARLRVDVTPAAVTVRAELHVLEETAVPLPVRPAAWSPAEVTVDGAPAPGLQRGNDGVLWIHLAPGAHQVILRGAPPAGATFQLPLPLPPRRVDAAVEGWSVEGIDAGLAVGGQLQFTRVKSAAREEAVAELQPGELPPLVRVERTLQLGLDWHVDTRVVRVSPPGVAVVLKVPLLAGESVTSEDITVESGHVLVNMAARDGEFRWRSTLEKGARIELRAPETTHWVETWRADISPMWHAQPSGIAVVHHQDNQGRWLPEWRPWPGETVTLEVSRPKGVPGQTLTLDEVRLDVAPGKRATDTTATFTLRSSRGGQHMLSLPEGTELQSVTIDGIPQPIRATGGKVNVPLVPGTQTVALMLRDATGIGTWFRSAALDAGVAGVNTRVHVTLGQDRWVLMLGGLPLGPAVLFWGVLTVVVLIAVGLGRVHLTPLTTWHWILLGIGLTQTQIWVGLAIVGWLLALGVRGRQRDDVSRFRFNAVQVALFLLTLLALVMLFQAVKHGLLGYPQMQISGNGSSAHDLHWYQDRSDAALPQAWILSVPLWVYRGLMLAWALWLAFALLRWLRWGWECVSSGGLWKSRPAADIVLRPAPGQEPGSAPPG